MRNLLNRLTTLDDRTLDTASLSILNLAALAYLALL